MWDVFLGRGLHNQLSLNQHTLNKIIRTQSLLCVIDRATQSPGRGIKGGYPGQKCFAMCTNMAAKFKL